MNLHAINPLNPPSASALFAHFRMPPPKNREDWRLMPENERKFGQIRGLPSFVGKAVATNGILVALVNLDEVKIGHLDWFVPDVEPKEVRIKQPRTSARVARQKKEYV